MTNTKPTVIRIETTDAGQRLDVFLSEKMSITRSQIQKMIDLGKVLLNEKPPKKAGERLSVGDQITITESSNLPILKSSETKNQKIEKPKDLKIDIICETKDYLVVNKPAGMLTHSTTKNEPDSLAAILAKKYPGIKKVGDDPTIRPGIVHRLDKEASGLLVVARNQKMFDHLKEQFKNRTITKEYSVLVHGAVAKDWGEITFPIDRGEGDRMVAIPSTVKGLVQEEGRLAHTEFLVEKRFVNFTLLRVTLHTGRMHQIRVHMLAYNHPVAGDPIYFQKKRPTKWDDKCGRLFLHCVKLGFVDLKGEKQSFELDLPKNLEEFLKLLK